MHMYGQSKEDMNLVKKTCDIILRSDNKTTLQTQSRV